MKGPVDYFRKECSLVEVRASGRVMPAVLDPVRVKMGNAVSRLHDLATIGVRDGSMLLVTLFDEQNMKAVEGAIYEAKLPGIVPQRLDVRTIKIPVARPTVETRNNLLAGAQRKAEEARVHIRKHLKTSVKKGCYEKHSIELEEFNKVAHKYIAEVDKILVDLKTAISK
ncbi:ribosome recycling factor [Fistulina hepatica ATCC 64428]|uniref:Ribosome recycling factor n=1 Tax=Fistulina hepatica ATCC 64428 TaxID=1128425 RepID=A0A0D7ADG7_9AGAR|nr:ribosome recycling factor [Fistulina hepatica ATCC 64428]